MLDLNHITAEYMDYCTKILADTKEQKQAILKAAENAFCQISNDENNMGAVLCLPFFDSNFRLLCMCKMGLYLKNGLYYLCDLEQVEKHWRNKMCDCNNYTAEIDNIASRHKLRRERSFEGCFIRDLPKYVINFDLPIILFDFMEAIYELTNIQDYTIKTRIYVIRHGETVWNKLGITQGRSDNPLSEEGEQQAQNAAEFLALHKVDLIISSPLRRTMQTAQIMNATQQIKLITDERITEIEQGIFTGKVYAELTKAEQDRKALRRSEDGMESYALVYERVKDFLNDIRVKYKGKTIFIVTHKVVAGIIQGICESQNGEIAQFDTLGTISNGQIIEYTI